MQLDRTRIAIRERDAIGILDLALHVFRNYAGPLSLAAAFGVVPMLLVNHVLIGWMADVDYREEFPMRYIWNLWMLVYLEAPLGTAFATYFLGQAVFVDRPRMRDVLREVLRAAPALAWCHLGVRGVGAAWLLLVTLDRFDGLEPAVEGFLLPCLVLYAAAIRSFRPFMNEIILLERNPLRSRDPNRITVGRRSQLLHLPSSGDLLGRSVLQSLLAVLLLLSVYGGLLFVSGVFFNDWEPGPLLIQIWLPLSMWVVALYLSVTRFLSYLDTRIRYEGWEIELRLRAEASRVEAAARGGWA